MIAINKMRAACGICVLGLRKIGGRDIPGDAVGKNLPSNVGLVPVSGRSYVPQDNKPVTHSH